MTALQEEDRAPEAVITRDEYARRLEAMLTACDVIRRRYGWCEQWLPTLLRLTGDIRARDANHGTAEVRIADAELMSEEMFTPDGWVKYQAKMSARYSEELARIRGRVLTIARNGTIEPRDARSVIQAIGLTPIGDNMAAAYSVEYMHPTLYIEDPGTQEEIAARVSAAYQAFLTEVHAVLDDRTGMSFHPPRVRPARLDGANQIPASECVPLR